MALTLFQTLTVFLSLTCVFGADVGCNLKYNGGWGQCVQNGCCQYDFHETNPDLCDGTGQVCCYRNDLCGRDRNDFCFRVWGTWISRYAHHGTQAEVTAAFMALRDLGITRVYFNVWANGDLYAQSSTATSNGANYVKDSLSYAVNAAQSTGLEVYAWFEYGLMSNYGTSPQGNDFAMACDAKDWLLYNMVGGSKVYNTAQGGNFVYMNANKAEVRAFMVDFVRDIIINYPGLHGVQLDDHFSFTAGFSLVDSLPQSTRHEVTRSLMNSIYTAAKAARPSIKVSFSPSPLNFARTNHNVDWAAYFSTGIVDEVVPQYYRSTANDYRNILLQDIPSVTGYQTGMIGGIRLSGSGSPTPSGEATEMIRISYENRLKGVSFWFADDLIGGGYVPPGLKYC